jgi:hypothetical protein
MAEAQARAGIRPWPTGGPGRMLYHVLAIRLETFSKEPMKIFMVSNRAESKEHNGIKVMTIPLVESMEMIIEVEGILG